VNNFISALFNNLLHFMHKNREESLHKKSGWHERLREIYVCHHKARQGQSGLNHP
jgi:hypothetical protein